MKTKLDTWTNLGIPAISITNDKIPEIIIWDYILVFSSPDRFVVFNCTDANGICSFSFNSFGISSVNLFCLTLFSNINK